MGSGKIYDLQEIIQKTSDDQMKAHLVTLKKFVERGYRFEDQDEKHESGLNGERLNTTLMTVLRPSSTTLPMIKFEAKQVFGTYDFGKKVFTKWESPKFEVKMLKKSADIKAFNAPWQGVELPAA